ncbi:hypothetical protein Pmar_PMAR018159 [Perkinsus marinus ATCC 50983]|uniref:Uncharacterized protein n=1 Tax=Perkinsus marinus (strain ATCC 50983 / TXsc) TaxID=423536 RepID=C5KFX3_PERM5|nr:hypothetical protein Pmar_PMAR018159 [Perkinsus marinus ATCC 50983]EER16621.1 hypothetical protein Pmar_PMAR018159 [Perkinsus marinus ATCC 50983]|eukprot:XP_002784825.1 hypothetical protein Pmar_PMAR018159 [Perkinsus marinus ATCC 50983]
MPLSSDVLDLTDEEVYDYYHNFVDQLHRGFTLVKDATLENRLRQKKYYDNQRVDPPEVQVGSWLFVRSYNNPRLGYRWSLPLKVSKLVGDHSVYLVDPKDDAKRPIGPYNLDHCLPADDFKLIYETASSQSNQETGRLQEGGEDDDNNDEVSTADAPASVSDDHCGEDHHIDIERYIHQLLLNHKGPMSTDVVRSYLLQRFGPTRDIFRKVGGFRAFVERSANIGFDSYGSLQTKTLMFHIPFAGGKM